SVLVSISRFEGLPNAVIEGMACSCPLVVSDIPAHRELLDEDSAVFVSTDDPVEVADAIRNVLATPEAARERARRARSRAQLYSVAAAVDGFEHVYRTVLPQNGSGMVRRN
ncbi:MAG: glycosyltransferase, partial [Longimicrobiales bacterium]